MQELRGINLSFFFHHHSFLKRWWWWWQQQTKLLILVWFLKWNELWQDCQHCIIIIFNGFARIKLAYILINFFFEYTINKIELNCSTKVWIQVHFYKFWSFRLIFRSKESEFPTYSTSSLINKQLLL